MKNPRKQSKVIGITGGIGSGKSLISELFNSLNYPVYNSDLEAKKIYQVPRIKKLVVRLLGEESYEKDLLNKAYIAQKVFSDSGLLEQLNAIIHPSVGAHFLEWKKNQKSAFVIKEAAILIESGAYKSCDYIINVSAPEKIRIARVIKRDSVLEKEVQARIEKQLSDKERNAHANWIILNDGSESVIKQVMEIHRKLEKTPV